MSRTPPPAEPHAQIWDQLSWYANGTLPDTERSAVEAHLEGCEECQSELEFLIGLSTAMTDEEALLVSPERSLAAVSERIDALEAARRGRFGWADIARIVGAKLTARRASGWSLRPALAALGLILIVAVVGGLASGLFDPAFRTLSSESQVVVGEERAIRLVFAGEATIQEVHGLLQRLDISLVGGPSTYGVYTARVAAGAGDARLDDVLIELREHPLVSFAEPIGDVSVEGDEP